jgi:phosphatidate cytidylyltransferase
MMRQRLISAAVLVPIVVIVFLAGDPWIAIAIAALGALAAYETAVLVRTAGMPANTWLAVAAPPLAVLGLAFGAAPRVPISWGFAPPAWVFVAPAIGLWLVVAALPSLRFSDAAEGFRAWVGTVLASLYPSLLAFAAALSFVIWPVYVADDVISLFDRGRVWLLALVLTVWSLDSAAYVIGRYFPRGRFMNHISPKKTWSGAIGGTTTAVVVCAAVLQFTAEHELIGGAVIGLAVAVAAQIGDLIESILKRAAGAKDSGRLIPGHGGFLDRVDSFLFAAPVMYVALLMTLFNADIAK